MSRSEAIRLIREILAQGVGSPTIYIKDLRARLEYLKNYLENDELEPIARRETDLEKIAELEAVVEVLTRHLNDSMDEGVALQEQIVGLRSRAEERDDRIEDLEFEAGEARNEAVRLGYLIDRARAERDRQWRCREVILHHLGNSNRERDEARAEADKFRALAQEIGDSHAQLEQDSAEAVARLNTLADEFSSEAGLRRREADRLRAENAVLKSLLRDAMQDADT